MVQTLRVFALLGLLLTATSLDAPVSCDSKEECSDLAKQSQAMLQIKNAKAMKKDLATDLAEDASEKWLWGCGKLNNGGYELGIWWGGSGRIDSKIEGKIGAGMWECKYCWNNLVKVQGYQCSENTHCYDKGFWGTWFVSDNCWKTPSPTPAPPTPAPPGPTPAPTSRTLAGDLVDSATGAAVKDASVVMKMGTAEKKTTTDGRGHWELNDVPTGNGTISYSKEGVISITDAIAISPNAAVAPIKASVSKALPPQDWRIVLSWKPERDLDSYTYLGNCVLNYNQKSGTCDGVSSTLDLDSRKGNKPETTTLQSLKTCTGKCEVTFKVSWYEGLGTWADSEAKVRVYKGNHVEKEFTVSDGARKKCAGKAIWAVFTLNGKTGVITPYTGDACT